SMSRRLPGPERRPTSGRRDDDIATGGESSEIPAKVRASRTRRASHPARRVASPDSRRDAGRALPARGVDASTVGAEGEAGVTGELPREPAGSRVPHADCPVEAGRCEQGDPARREDRSGVGAIETDRARGNYEDTMNSCWDRDDAAILSPALHGRRR